MSACSPDTDIREALKIMRQNQVRRLPIIDAVERRLAGLLSLNDVALKAQSEGDAELSARDVGNAAGDLRASIAAACCHSFTTGAAIGCVGEMISRHI